MLNEFCHQSKLRSQSMSNTQQQILQIKSSLARLPRFKSRCYVCQTKKSKRGFTFHHLWYIINDVVRKNFPKSLAGTLQYYQKLEPLIREEPKRFLYVCNPHHQAITRLKMWKKNFNRLIRAVRMTR